jgi:FK506-binding nuclear protein
MPDVDNDGDDDEDYDYPPDMDELDDDISDDLDPIETAKRVEELDSEEEAPKLVATDSKKGKNKRPAEEEAEGLDDLIAKDAKLSKKQLKKLKNNSGEAVATEEKAAKDSPASKSDKKVQFAKNLEQGPTGPAKDKADKAKGDKNATGNVKVVQGVKIDDRKVGTGRTAKNGDKVGMRYIGKLENGKVFDGKCCILPDAQVPMDADFLIANKKGPAFSFKLGKGEVIKGWDIGIAGMAVGGERRLTIPPSLAYGSKGMPGIPANSTLIFDVKLLEIK